MKKNLFKLVVSPFPWVETLSKQLEFFISQDYKSTYSPAFEKLQKVLIFLIVTLFLTCASSQKIDNELDSSSMPLKEKKSSLRKIKKSSKKKKKSTSKKIYDWDRDVSGPGSQLN